MRLMPYWTSGCVFRCSCSGSQFTFTQQVLITLGPTLSSTYPAEASGEHLKAVSLAHFVQVVHWLSISFFSDFLRCIYKNEGEKE